MGMLTATLLVFGRFSADQELTAVRASGISLLSLISPILLLSLALCALSALVNMEIGPALPRRLHQHPLQPPREFSGAQMPEGRAIKDFPGYIFYVGRNRNGDLQDVMVWVFKDETNTRDLRPRGPRQAGGGCAEQAHHPVSLRRQERWTCAKASMRPRRVSRNCRSQLDFGSAGPATFQPEDQRHDLPASSGTNCTNGSSG